MTTAESFKRFRKKLGLSQANVAKALGITQQSYAVYESNGTPTIKTLINIADIFNVSTDYLLGRVDDPNPYKGTNETNEVNPEEKELTIGTLQTQMNELQEQIDEIKASIAALTK